MNIVEINGKKFPSLCKRVIVKGWKIFIDDVDVTPESEEVVVKIIGPVEYLQADACDEITITGLVGAARIESGSSGTVIRNHDGTTRICHSRRAIVIDDEEVIPNEKIISLDVKGDISRMEIHFCRVIDIFGEISDLHMHCSGFGLINNTDGFITTESSGVGCNR